MGHTEGVILRVDILIALVQLVLEAVGDLIVPLEVLDLKVSVQAFEIVPLVLDAVVQSLDGLLEAI